MFPFRWPTIPNLCGTQAGLHHQLHHIRLLTLRANFTVEIRAISSLKLRLRLKSTRFNNRMRYWTSSSIISPWLTSTIFNSWCHTNRPNQHLPFQLHHSINHQQHLHRFNLNHKHPWWRHQVNHPIHQLLILSRSWVRWNKSWQTTWLRTKLTTLSPYSTHHYHPTEWQPKSTFQ